MRVYTFVVETQRMGAGPPSRDCWLAAASNKSAAQALVQAQLLDEKIIASSGPWAGFPSPIFPIEDGEARIWTSIG